jgi:hypothetical protein
MSSDLNSLKMITTSLTRLNLKRFISILLLFFFIYNSIGFLAIYPILSAYYKYLGMQEAKMPSKEEMIELLVFNKEDILNQKINFKWIHSREFRYNGDMYDIVKKEENETQLIVYCINDTKEKRFEDEFEKRVHQNTSENKQRPSANFQINILLSEAVQNENMSTELLPEYIFREQLIFGYKSHHLEIPSPPPRFV